jgi:hypothetical protein
VSFALKSISSGKAWIPASSGMTKSSAIFRRFSHQRTLFHHPVSRRDVLFTGSNLLIGARSFAKEKFFPCSKKLSNIYGLIGFRF